LTNFWLQLPNYEQSAEKSSPFFGRMQMEILVLKGDSVQQGNSNAKLASPTRFPFDFMHVGLDRSSNLPLHAVLGSQTRADRRSSPQSARYSLVGAGP
jgi:hypothetical protein